MTNKQISEREQKLIEIDDRIDSYIKGEMSFEEEKKFLSDCRVDVKLRERAYMVALLAKSLRQ